MQHPIRNKKRLIIKAPNSANDTTNVQPHEYWLATKYNMSAFNLSHKGTIALHYVGVYSFALYWHLTQEGRVSQYSMLIIMCPYFFTSRSHISMGKRFQETVREELSWIQGWRLDQDVGLLGKG